VKSGQQIVASSATGLRAELQKEFEGDTVVADMIDLASGSPFAWFQRIIKKAPDLFKNEQVAENVAKILNTGKPAELNKLLRDLEERATKFAAERSRIEKVGLTGSKGTGRMAGESPIGADVEEDEFVPPSAVEGGNDGDYTSFADVEAEEEEPEPELVQEQRRGGRIVKRMQEGGYVIEDPNTLKEILKRTEFSAYADRGKDASTRQQFATGRVGYRQPIGNDRQVGVGVSGMHMKYSGRTPEGEEFKGKKNAVSGADVSYGDKRNQLYMRYGLPMNGKNLQFAESGYSRDLGDNRGTVGIRHSELSPEGIPNRDTQLFYKKDFRNGGAVTHKALGGVIRKMHK
jgi:hypothetical protein